MPSLYKVHEIITCSTEISTSVSSASFPKLLCGFRLNFVFGGVH